MADENFTQLQVDEQIENAKTKWTEQELNPLVTERDDLLQHKPKDLTDDEKAFETKQQGLWGKEVNLSLKENGLEQFADVIKVADEDELNQVVTSLTKIKNDMKVESGYVPKDKAKDDEYSNFEKNKDTKNMISSKLAGLFK